MRVKNFLKDFGFVISSNLLTLAISTIVILIVPKLIGVTEYGYWQLFMFYSGYLGILPFGWLDGIYLRYGGAKYDDLDKSLFKSQFTLLMLLQIFFACIIIAVAVVLNDERYSFILYALAVYLLIYIAQSFCQFVLQITNRISEYSVVSILANVIYVVSVISFIIFDLRDFRLLIISFIFGNFMALLYAMYILKDLFLQRSTNENFWSLGEAYLNIKVGSQLLMANAAALLIIGVVRIGIQRGWGVAEFGKVSLTFSISNLLMVFINSVSLIIFPRLKRIDLNKVSDIYSNIRDILMPLVFIGMLAYFPINYLIPMWLPKYDSALIYISVLFPMTVYQSKFEVLSNTFMKVLRMEHQLLIINIITLIISILLTAFSVFVLHNLTATVFVIITVMAIRSTMSEIYIKSRLSLKFSSEMILETIMVVTFILLSWYLPTIGAMISYLAILIVYLIIKKQDVFVAIKQFKSM